MTPNEMRLRALPALAWATRNLCTLAVVFGLAAALPSAARGEMIEIQLGGVDISYDGLNIVDADPGNGDPDPLNTVTFLLDNVMVGSVLTTGISLDMLIPNVLNIAQGGDIVVSGAGGYFDLDLPGADFLNLDLDQATITYVNSTTIQFAYAGSVASLDGQSLPFGLELADPITISFSTQINPGSLVNGGGVVEEFTANGTGEIRGTQVPEPATVVLAGCGGLALLGLSLRRKIRSR